MHIAGLTPAQVQLLMNAPAHQVNALAAQLGILDTGARPGNLPNNLSAPAPNLAANQALLQQQKLAAARASYANQQVQAQRTAANPMLGLQQPQQPPLMGLQQARQVDTQRCPVPASLSHCSAAWEFCQLIGCKTGLGTPVSAACEFGSPIQTRS